MSNEKDNIYYIPKDVVIGKGKPKTYSDEKTDIMSKISEIAIPSCRFMLKTWTNMNQFESISGFRPSRMVDKVMEINKDITGNVFNIDNVPTSGFKLKNYSNVSMLSNYVNYMSPGYVIIEDPRGFHVELTGLDFWAKIVENHIPISETGEIGCDFVYVWITDKFHKSKERGWTLMTSEMLKNENVIRQSDLESSLVENPGIRSKDLVPGTVYDCDLGDNNPKRALYLGNLKFMSPSNMTDFFYHNYVSSFSHITSRILENRYHGYDLPWNTDSWNDTLNGMKDYINQNIFIILGDEYYNSNKFWYLEKKMKISNFIPHKKCEQDRDINILRHMKIMNGGRKIRSISNDQRIKPEWNPAIEYTFEEIMEGFKNFSENLEIVVSKLSYMFSTTQSSIYDLKKKINSTSFTELEKNFLN